MAEVEGPGLWADKEKPNWLGVWSHLSHCPSCHTLMNSSGPCPKCGFAFEPMEHRWTDASGATRTHLSMAVPGAFSVTTATLLSLMQREWERPASENEKSRSFIEQVSPKLILVILFWTLFEHLMDRFFSTAVASLPEGVGRDLLERYASIGSRMGRLYPLLFGTTLEPTWRPSAMGGSLHISGRCGPDATTLCTAMRPRSTIRSSGKPSSDCMMQGAVVALFNLRCAGNPGAPPMWREGERKGRGQ